jgi:HK97 family phage portal protein
VLLGPVVHRIATSAPELRQASDLTNPRQWLVDVLGGGPTSSGIRVNAENALTFAAVYACVRVISEDIASLPLITYERLADGSRRRRDDLPIARKLHTAPNDEMTRVQFFETYVANMALRGNGFAFVQRTVSNQVANLWPLRADQVAIERDNGGRLLFVWRPTTSSTPPAREAISPRTFTFDQIMHAPLFTREGIVGVSPVAVAREAIALGLTAQAYGARLFNQDATPGGVLTHPNALTPEARDNLRSSWRQSHEGFNRSHRVAVLEEGMKWERMGLSPEDSQFLESRKFQVAEVARIYRVPPHMIGDLEHATFSNIENQALGYVKHTLRPWLVRLELALKRDVFGLQSPFFAEFLVDGLLRGDLLSRYQAYRVGHEGGWLTRNEIRRFENLNPDDSDGEGDTFLRPANIVPADTPANGATNGATPPGGPTNGGTQPFGE